MSSTTTALVADRVEFQNKLLLHPIYWSNITPPAPFYSMHAAHQQVRIGYDARTLTIQECSAAHALVDLATEVPRIYGPLSVSPVGQ